MKFNVEKQCITFMIDRELYGMEVICKAGYKFTNYTYVFFEKLDINEVKVTLETKEFTPEEDLYKIGKEFWNELLAQKVRLDISKSTKNIRELIVGRALYSTCLEVETEYGMENIVETEKADRLGNEECDMSLENIAVNWFEQYDRGEVENE